MRLNVSTQSSWQCFNHVLQLGDFQRLPQSVIRTGALGIQVKSDKVDNIHVKNKNLLVKQKIQLLEPPLILGDQINQMIGVLKLLLHWLVFFY